MLPLSLLRTACGHPMLIELKSGDTYNGILVACDPRMNIHLREVICTSRDGDRFWQIAECFVRGNTIKYLRIPDKIIDMVQDDEEKFAHKAPGDRGRGRGGRGNMRGGGGGRGRGGSGPPSGGHVGSRGGYNGGNRGRGGMQQQ